MLPPTDVLNPQAWDDFWQAQIDHGPIFDFFPFFTDGGEIAALARRLGLERVLCAGNGISLEPRALAGAGLDVTVLDLSPYATALAEGAQTEPRVLEAKFQCPRARKPGPIRYVAGDLLDRTVSTGPFDFILERRTLQLLAAGGHTEDGIEALAARLASPGVLMSQCHMGRWRPGEPRIHPLEPDLRRHGFVELDPSARRETLPERGMILQFTSG